MNLQYLDRRGLAVQDLHCQDAGHSSPVQIIPYSFYIFLTFNFKEFLGMLDALCE